MDDKEENVDFMREEVYAPQHVPAIVKRPNNLTPGQRYKIINEEDSGISYGSPLYLYCKLQYRVKDDIGRTICVPECFFEHPADKPLLHESGEHREKLQRDNFDLRIALSELMREGKAEYTEDITYHDLGINAQRMTPTQAKSEWVRVLKIAGISKGNPKSEFLEIEKASQEMQKTLKDLNNAIEKTEMVMFGATQNGK